MFLRKTSLNNIPNSQLKTVRKHLPLVEQNIKRSFWVHSVQNTLESSNVKPEPKTPASPIPPKIGQEQTRSDGNVTSSKKLRNSFLFLAFLGLTGYAGGVWYSFENPKFYDVFAKYAPFGDKVLPAIEHSWIGYKFFGGNKILIHDRPKMMQPNASPGVSREVVENAKRKEKAIPSELKQDKPTNEESNVKHETNANSADEVKENAKYAAVSDLGLDQETGLSVTAAPAIAHTLQRAHEEELKDQTRRFESSLNEAHQLRVQLSQLQEEQKELYEKRLKSKMEEWNLKMDDVLAVRDQEWRELFEQEKQRLQIIHDSRLHEELVRATAVYETKLKNELTEQAIEMERMHLQAVKAQVEQERGSRLGKLSELRNAFDELQNLARSVMFDNGRMTKFISVQKALEKVEKDINFRNNQSLEKDLQDLKDASQEDQLSGLAFNIIDSTLQSGPVLSKKELQMKFDVLSREIYKTCFLTVDSGFLGHLKSIVLSQLPISLFKSPEIQSVRGVLNEARSSLIAEDYDSVVKSLLTLSQWSRALSKDWIESCRRKMELQQAINIIKSSALYASYRQEEGNE
ncbi:mitofilin [Schizosaccharomyces cryophilus OY26]|uniref:MICOS complex subunit MIC60 n=1 Tax=Schizosaccharomyces cryophilus (strain OY26 / ATCC MYA-4695 / CBS 11777 / NBRC 106824 / NRRL Y48691) TaxID=653667 RepID=S9X9P3_SCHCR|nr:mitofilin [Schizosaccharomyces cryophilus OY26]EPY53867.1 mitofilin [Schizosaccharomyces cryophilus OY26]